MYGKEFIEECDAILQEHMSKIKEDLPAETLFAVFSGMAMAMGVMQDIAKALGNEAPAHYLEHIKEQGGLM